MFYKKSHSANEIEAALFETLAPSSEEDGIQTALQSLANSADLFEAANLPEEAEVITQFIETIASGQFAMVKEAKKKAKNKSKTKGKSKTKTKTKTKPSKMIEFLNDKATEGLTPEKEVKNLSEVGWVFNMPSDCGECSDSFMADDGFDSEVSQNDNDVPEDVPMDYEECGECGWDHAYEPGKSWKFHHAERKEK